MPNNLPFIHKYPQKMWANEIVSVLKDMEMFQDAALVDAPCGNGIIAYFIKKAFPDKSVYAFDLDEKLLDSNYLKDPEVPVFSNKSDVFKEKIEGANNIWLLVNSLYCLPDRQTLLEFNKPCYEYIITIVPDTTKSNFIHFTSRHPEFKNPSQMTIEETVSFFQNNGYELFVKKGITKIPFHKWSEKLNRFKFPLFVKNFIFNLFDTLTFFGTNQYQLLAFKRI